MKINLKKFHIQYNFLKAVLWSVHPKHVFGLFLYQIQILTSIDFTFTLIHLADAFIQSDLQCIQAIHFFMSMCVPWELIPQPFALLTQCSTTDPLDFYLTKINFKGFHTVYYFLKAVFMETQKY